MVVNGKQGVRQEIRIRISRPSSPYVARQAGRRRENLSEDFLRLTVRTVAVFFFIVCILCQFLRWRTAQEYAEFERLTAVHADVSRQHAELLAQRDQLLAESRIVAAAAVRLGLYPPEPEQEHRLY